MTPSITIRTRSVVVADAPAAPRARLTIVIAAARTTPSSPIAHATSVIRGAVMARDRAKDERGPERSSTTVAGTAIHRAATTAAAPNGITNVATVPHDGHRPSGRTRRPIAVTGTSSRPTRTISGAATTRAPITSSAGAPAATRRGTARSPVASDRTARAFRPAATSSRTIVAAPKVARKTVARTTSAGTTRRTTIWTTSAVVICLMSARSMIGSATLSQIHSGSSRTASSPRPPSAVRASGRAPRPTRRVEVRSSAAARASRPPIASMPAPDRRLDVDAVSPTSAAPRSSAMCCTPRPVPRSAPVRRTVELYTVQSQRQGGCVHHRLAARAWAVRPTLTPWTPTIETRR